MEPRPDTLIKLPELPLPIAVFLEKGRRVYQIDTRISEPPTPLVMGLAALRLINGPGSALIHLNHSVPKLLIERASGFFSIDVEKREEDFRIRFGYLAGCSEGFVPPVKAVCPSTKGAS